MHNWTSIIIMFSLCLPVVCLLGSLLQQCQVSCTACSFYYNIDIFIDIWLLSDREVVLPTLLDCFKVGATDYVAVGVLVRFL